MNTNLTLMTDFYQLTMMQGYFKNKRNNMVVFDLFYRTNPCGNGYAVAAGLEQAISYLKELHFSKEDIAYLRSLSTFDEDFLDYLGSFRFTGDIYAVPEGTVVFPMEPLIKVIAPLMEAQLIETTLLNIINHQSLIATKAARVCQAAGDSPVMEFGLRRAQGPDAATFGARAAIIGGCTGTSNVLAGKNFQVPVLGTHAHSWIMSFPDELTAFRNYASLYPQNTTLLVDTYDTLHSGVPNAIQVFKELKQAGKMPVTYGIRLDSGDLAYLSKESRKMLDSAGFSDAKICASSDLDEYLISSLKSQGAKIDIWGVGTNLITSKDCPSFGGVYKLSGVWEEEGFVPKIKVSENPKKITNPGNKTIYRIYQKNTKMIRADVISLASEQIDCSKELLLFDPISTWKKTRLAPDSYEVRELLVPVFKNGQLVYQTPTLKEIQSYCSQEKNSLWEESRRLINPNEIYVDLSQELFDLKNQLLSSISI